MNTAIRKLGLGLWLALMGSGALAQTPITPVTGQIYTQNLVAGGACTDGGCVEIDTRGIGAVSVQVTGTYTGALSGQITTDGITWVTFAGTSTFARQTTALATATVTSGQQDVYVVSVVGARKFRVTGLAAMTGTAIVTIQPAALSIASSGGGSGGAVTIADGASVTLGTTTDAKSTATDATSVTLMQVAKQISASAQSTKTGVDTLHTDITATNTQLPAALGQTTAAASLSIVQASDATPTVAQGSTTSGQKGNLTQGAVTTSAPSYTTAQTSPLSLRTDGSLRMFDMALPFGGSTPATSVATFNASATGTQSIVAASASDTTCLAANAARKGATLTNDSASASLYLLLSNATSSTTVYTVLLTPGGYYEMPFSYTGVLKCIWSAAVGNARVTEITN